MPCMLLVNLVPVLEVCHKRGTDRHHGPRATGTVDIEQSWLVMMITGFCQPPAHDARARGAQECCVLAEPRSQRVWERDYPRPSKPAQGVYSVSSYDYLHLYLRIMSLVLKHLISGRSRRYTEDGFDLDLTCIHHFNSLIRVWQRNNTPETFGGGYPGIV